MTKKILIDETVVKQALTVLKQCLDHHDADDAIAALREALEVNNKGVNALAEQPDYSICPACGGMAADPIVPVEARQRAAEPVAMTFEEAWGSLRWYEWRMRPPKELFAELYKLTAPTQQDGTNGVVALQPLTDDQIRRIELTIQGYTRQPFDVQAFARAIEAAHGITSTNKGD